MPFPELFADAERAEFAACFHLLATAFRFSPQAPDTAAFLAIVRDRMLATAWPCGNETKLDAINNEMAADLSETGLHDAFQRLFIGPDAFEAPAWGSVYLDRESVLFGESTLELRAFLVRHGAALNTGMNEPEDHIGLLMWLAGDFLAASDDAVLQELLEQHLLPWSGRYLELLAAHAAHPFYIGLSQLTVLTLSETAKKMGLSPAAKTLYR